jgi:hypothetical protein
MRGLLMIRKHAKDQGSMTKVQGKNWGPSLAIDQWSVTIPRCERRGTILVVVLVVLVMLTLAAYNYTQFMMTELEASAMHAQDVQARVLADSGADYVAVLLANRGQPGYENLQDNPSLFLGVGVSESGRARGRGRFTIIAPVEHDTAAAAVRYGLMDESAKLNLNMLDKLQLDDTQSRTLLMGLPGMTEYIADSIRDWIDTDDTMRQYGAESEYYENLSPPYEAKNGPLETIDELLLVQGVTPELLYGEDANRNGLLDPNENDGESSPPYDNADGYLQLGWYAFLTVHSRESNVRSDGTARINVNNGLLTDLYDQLTEEFNEETAKFVVGFRIAGAKDQNPATTATSGNTTATSSTSQQVQQQQNQLVQGAAKAVGEAISSGTGKVTRGGIDLTAGGQVQIKSLWELIGSRCDVTVNGTKQTLNSPWPDDAGSLSSVLPTLIDTLSISGDEFLEGRININQARREILIGLPNMTESLADSILAAQQVDPETLATRTTTGWLYTEGLVSDIWAMRELDKYLTARGDVYRAQILGFFDGGGPVARLEVLVDGTQLPPRVTFCRDLNDLGRGYARLQMLPPEMR